MTRRRKIAVAAAAAALLLAGLGVGAVWLVQSRWFYRQVRARLVRTVEEATGGRVEISTFLFDWRTLRAEVRGFTLHGTEPAGKPPLLTARSIAVGLKIVSLVRRDVDVRSVEVASPRVYVIVGPDGRTNIPQPRVKSRTNAAETILKLAIGQFTVTGGVFEVEGRGATPFDARGRDLAALFRYAAAPARYEGSVRVKPLEVEVKDGTRVPLDVAATATLESNRLTVTSARVSTGASALDVKGAVEDWTNPRGAFQYDARVSLGDVTRIFRVPELRGGEAEAKGTLAWSGSEQAKATGTIRAWNVGYRDSTLEIRGGRFDGTTAAVPGEILVSGGRISGTYVSRIGRAPAEGRIAAIVLRSRRLELNGVALNGLGGTFLGQARLEDWTHYTIAGDVAGFAARRVVALYSREPLPWDALAAGPVKVEGSLRDKRALRASGELAVTPVEGSAPVHGQITAQYEARGETLDLGRSELSLPSSHAVFAGAFGKTMQATLETRDLRDLLPLLGTSAADLPLAMNGGTARFEGTVTGTLDRPRFAGKLTATGFTVEGRPLDSLRADVTASPDRVQLQNAVAARGAVTAVFDAQAALADWKLGDASAIYGKAQVVKAPVGDVLALADVQSAPMTGAVTAAAQFSGSVARPVVQGTVEIDAGAWRGEPFDRAAGQVAYSGDTWTLRSGEIAAGAKEVQVAAWFRHEPGRLDTGRVHFEVRTNVMPLEQVAILRTARPGVKGTLHVKASGDLELTPALRLESLEADAVAEGLELNGQPLGQAHLTAASEGAALKAHLEARIAGSAVRGDAMARLEGDDPATGTVTFSRIDMAQLRPWLSKDAGAAPVTGFAQGEIKIDGPLLKPEAIRAEVRLPLLEVGPTPSAGVPMTLALHNQGPIVATVVNGVATLTSLRLVGRATDVAVTGKINLKDANPIDARVAGRIDLAAVHDFNPDFTASGFVTADAGVRGTFAAPRITGRVQFQNAAFNVADVPNGISGAAGVILFTGDRATIQTFTGETGGGKVDLTGFAGFEQNHLVFQLHARANEVRIRYPEGVSTVADANLRLTGTSDRSTLSGTVTIRRTGFNPQSDFSSVIARSAEPVRTPSARTGLLGGINFDVQIESAPDIQFQSSLTQDLQVDVNLRLRGTLSNPALVGRINITQGQVVFYGTKYTIHQGSIAFYNPLKIEPVFDIDLDTKARGIDITLTISGPLNKLNLTPRSDPPLQFSEIVQLLATGDAPALDPTLAAAGPATASQGWQQMGASALLGQAIASPVAGRLQRFFGVSRLRIDPTQPGIETMNPQARVTLEQQITPDITFTYVTVVTSSNPQVVRMEWAFARQWSAVLLREENGVFGLDFFFKKRF
jgi:translocation and assembly module TamB